MVLEVDRMIRNWGEWEVLHSLGTTKVKKITVNPGSELSYQRHFHRSEIWYVHQGTGIVLVNFSDNPKDVPDQQWPLEAGLSVVVIKKLWHQLINTGKEPLVIIEIQYGDKCIEDDIERVG